MTWKVLNLTQSCSYWYFWLLCLFRFDSLLDNTWNSTNRKNVRLQILWKYIKELCWTCIIVNDRNVACGDIFTRWVQCLPTLKQNLQLKIWRCISGTGLTLLSITTLFNVNNSLNHGDIFCDTKELFLLIILKQVSSSLLIAMRSRK